MLKKQWPTVLQIRLLAVVTNKNIFCNSPWYELQIYWDGSLGFCCRENQRLYSDDLKSHYNVQNMSIRDWFDSEPMRRARMMMFDNKRNSICTLCYNEENIGTTSRRNRSNQKSVIFTNNFEESFDQSPGWHKFTESQQQQGAYDGMPIDVHIDLGNYCNLTCKMCKPQASSRVASQHVAWGIESAQQYIGTDWTRNNQAWNKVRSELADIPNLKNIHFMGGETLLTPKFAEFVDFMIERKRFDINFSFVTNGTVYNQELLNKLMLFDRVGIEVSIETLTDHNSYQRQGTDTSLVLNNIDRYLEHCNNNSVTLTIRPAISSLTIGYYDTLLEYCLTKKLVVKSLLVAEPYYFDSKILPHNVRKLYLEQYNSFIIKHGLDSVDCNADFNESDPGQIEKIIKKQVMQCIGLLESPRPASSSVLLKEMVSWCRRWDNVHGYNALDLYPELSEVFVEHGY